jgi:hypothetical protein
MNDGKRNGNYTADSVRMKVKRFLKNFWFVRFVRFESAKMVLGKIVE